jgi:hypothetical protein
LGISMKFLATLALLPCLTLSSGLAAQAFAADQPPATQPADTPDPNAPNLTGTIDRETSAGTRDLGDPETAAVVAPLHARDATTSSASPKLIFYLPAATDRPVHIVIQEQSSDGKGAVLFDWQSPAKSPLAAGLHLLNLSAHNVKLPPGILCRWSVAIVLDSDESQQNTSWGVIQFVPSADSGSSFYDQLADVCTLLLSNSNDSGAQTKMKTMLDQQKIDYVHDITLTADDPAK